VVVTKSFNRSALKARVGKQHEESPVPLKAHQDECRVVAAKSLNQSALKIGKNHQESPSPLIER
jgi:hypothetical protein